MVMIQFFSQVRPPSGEKSCSQRAPVFVMLDHAARRHGVEAHAREARPMMLADEVALTTAPGAGLGRSGQQGASPRGPRADARGFS